MRYDKSRMPSPDQEKAIKGVLRSPDSMSWKVFALLKSPRVESLYGSWALALATPNSPNPSGTIITSESYEIISHQEAIQLHTRYLSEGWIPFSYRSLEDELSELLCRDGLKTMKRRPGFEHPGIPQLCAVKRPALPDSDEVKKLDYYSVFWKDPENTSKGSIWILHSARLGKVGFIQTEADIPFSLRSYRRDLSIARGKNWKAIYSDGLEYPFKASPQATKKVMANIASRWGNPPLKLRPSQGPIFRLEDLQDEVASHVYLVRLTTFHETNSGEAYYKIGKAKSIPRRIKQFGPCTLVESISLSSEGESLKVEFDLHARFAHLRRPGTEIFCIHGDDLRIVIEAFEEYRLCNGRHQK